MQIIRWILTIPVIFLSVLFALGNHEKVEFTYSPFHEGIELPVYVIGLAMLSIGFLLGSFITWINMHELRSQKRKQKKIIKTLEKEIEKAKESADEQQ